MGAVPGPRSSVADVVTACNPRHFTRQGPEVAARRRLEHKRSPGASPDGNDLITDRTAAATSGNGQRPPTRSGDVQDGASFSLAKAVRRSESVCPVHLSVKQS